MTIELNNYNLDECTEILLKQYISENPKYTMSKIALAFGVSERTVYRWMDKWDIKRSKPKDFSILAISFLEKQGYKISKNESNSTD